MASHFYTIPIVKYVPRNWLSYGVSNERNVCGITRSYNSFQGHEGDMSTISYHLNGRCLTAFELRTVRQFTYKCKIGESRISVVKFGYIEGVCNVESYIVGVVFFV